MLGVEISCRDLRKITLRFDPHQQQSTGVDPRNLLINHFFLFSPEKKENVFAYHYFNACLNEKSPLLKPRPKPTGYMRYSGKEEFSRMGLPNHNWRISYANQNYGLTPSYPSVICVPERFDDQFLK